MRADRSEYYKQYYLDHKERINQNSRHYRLSHPDVDKDYKARHKNEIAEKSREYYIRTKLGGDKTKMRKSKIKETKIEAVVETPKIKKPSKTPMERKREAIIKDLAIIQKRADEYKLLLNNIADADQSTESKGNERNQ
jgi:hypothetical protein